MKKAVYMISADSELTSHVEALKEIQRRLSEQMRFVESQAQTITERFRKERDPIWEKIIKRLMELKAVPQDYDKEKQRVSFDVESNLFFLDEIEDPKTLSEILESFQ